MLILGDSELAIVLFWSLHAEWDFSSLLEHLSHVAPSNPERKEWRGPHKIHRFNSSLFLSMQKVIMTVREASLHRHGKVSLEISTEAIAQLQKEVNVRVEGWLAEVKSRVKKTTRPPLYE